VLVLVSSAFAGGCGGSTHENAWCKQIKQSRPAFDVKKPDTPRAQAEFARLAAQAPPEIRADVIRIAEDARALWAGDPKFWLDKDRTDAYNVTLVKVDNYLHDECHADIPQRTKHSTLDASTSE
jgi:hypothetical protein